MTKDQTIADLRKKLKTSEDFHKLKKEADDVFEAQVMRPLQDRLARWKDKANDLQRRVDEYEAQEQRIITYDNKSLPYKAHEGPPLMNPTEALRLYRESLARRSSTLARAEMTEAQRANFAGDARPAT